LVGSVVDSRDVKDLEKQLVGEEASAANDLLGTHVDSLLDVNSERLWRIYPARTDPLGKDRYVIEIEKERIAAVSRVEKTPDAKLDIPRAAMLKDKVKGKPIAECAALLELGKPLLTVRVESTGLLMQLYEGRIKKDWGKPYYCVLKFDKDEICEGVEFHGVGASTLDEPLGSNPEATS
jgi:hypothetical protein